VMIGSSGSNLNLWQMAALLAALKVLTSPSKRCAIRGSVAGFQTWASMPLMIPEDFCHSLLRSHSRWLSGDFSSSMYPGETVFTRQAQRMAEASG